MSRSTPSSSAFGTVTVDVTLCGSVPRRELESLSLENGVKRNVLSSRTPNTSSYYTSIRDSFESTQKQCIASDLCSHLSNIGERASNRDQGRSSVPDFEAPTWAVPAPGESRLEPLYDTMMRQSAVNLKSRAVFRVGRSPLSHIQLNHDNCSRRHAMIFHHDNGSCYLVDCGSAHGTFVNGNRVQSPPKGGVVIPYKVRRGSIIRFGGPGAPQFMLKSFTFELDELREAPVTDTVLSPTSGYGTVVQHNTRLNSLGKTAKDSLFQGLSSKRSFDSVETVDSDIENKRIRCSSPPLSPEQQPLRLVSPDLSQPNKRRRVSFSSDPPTAFYPNLVSPDLSSDENEDA